MSRAKVAITVGGVVLDDWESYEVQTSLRDAASTCALSAGFESDRLAAVALGAEVRVTVDRRPIFTGFVTSRSRRGHRLDVGCHDLAWRLTRDVAPFGRLDDATIASFAQRVTGLPVTFSNASNRDLFGRGSRRAGTEPPVFDGRTSPIRVPPGASRWTALSEVLRRADLLAWVRADGKALVVARPNFGQEPRYVLRMSDRGRSTALDVSITESIESSYRAITVVGSSRVPRQSPTSYGASLRRGATAEDPSYPLDVRGLVVEELRSVDDAQALARAHLDDARSDQIKVSVRAPGLGVDGRLYAPDTIARVIDDRSGYDESAYVVGVTMQGTRDDESCSLDCVPPDTRIVIP